MGGKSGGKEAAMARADEQARQERIRQGTESINRTFFGGLAGDRVVAADAAFDPSGTYYNADGTKWEAPAAPSTASPQLLTMFNQADGATPTTPTAAAPTMDPREKAFRDAAAQGKLFASTKRVGGQFNDDFFAAQRQRYLDYAVPQLEDQFGGAQRELTFALDRAGQLNSSARAQRAAELQKKYGLNRQQIADQALSYETQARNNVESARSDLVSMLNATGDAQGAANSALARASALSQPAAQSPLAQMFADFTSTLGATAAAERSWVASGGQAGSPGLGLFGARRNSVQGS